MLANGDGVHANTEQGHDLACDVLKVVAGRSRKTLASDERTYSKAVIFAWQSSLSWTRGETSVVFALEKRVACNSEFGADSKMPFCALFLLEREL